MLIIYHVVFLHTDHDLDSCIGSYFISEEISSLAPDRPVYKLFGKNRYIYYWPSLMGWRIGNLVHMNSEEIELDFYRGYTFFTLIEDVMYTFQYISINQDTLLGQVGVQTFEPWESTVKWTNSRNQVYSRISLNCTSLEANIQKCQDNPCSSHSKCYGGLSTYYCDCDLGWTGRTCVVESKKKSKMNLVTLGMYPQGRPVQPGRT